MSVKASKPTEDVEKPSGYIDLSEQQLDELMARIAEAREHGMALSADDYDLLRSAVLTLATVQERISHKDLTIVKLQKLLGMVNSSEKLDKHPAKSGKNESDTKNGSGAKNGRQTDTDKKDKKDKQPVQYIGRFDAARFSHRSATKPCLPAV
jgi:transposase